VKRAGVVLAVLALAGCGGGKKTIPSTLPAGAPDAEGCKTLKTIPNPETRRAPKPNTALDPSKAYDVTLTTNCGSFTFRLDVKDSPHATASFVSLVRRGFFLGTIFHRIVPGFVIQGGDPTGTGASGPGYTTVDRPPASTKYTEGTVAMAKAQSQPPGAAGSQFFVVTGPDASTLAPDYAVIGHVTKGLDVAEHIGKLGDPATEQPLRLVEIQKATVDVH
jgi:cyclophilin family peptidyl-prolyl cis-trans isomerase